MTIEETLNQINTLVHKVRQVTVGAGIIKSIQTFTDKTTNEQYLSLILDISEDKGKYRSTFFNIDLNLLTVDPLDFNKGQKIVYVGVLKERWKKISENKFEYIGTQITGLKLEIYDKPISLNVSDVVVEVN